ncbi:tail assembly protein [Brucella intermedia]|uniref:tail assembly protein n=1 Tax=Brucella TaxID=234 RepID=UPI000946558F|nr:tail assembly protein [Brucella intermedia]
MMRTIYLHGEAGKLFGKKFELEVNSLAEAVRAIGCQVRGFKQYVAQRDFQCVRGNRKTGIYLGEQDVHFGLGGADLHIVPVLQGSGGKGAAIGKIIAGVLLAGVAFFAAPALSATAFGGITYSQLVTVGIGMALAGVSQMLSAQEKDEKEKESGMFSNAPRIATQGMPVPRWYGHMVVTNIPIISAGVHTEDVSA